MKLLRLKRRLFVFKARILMLMSDLRFEIEKSLGGTFNNTIRDRRQTNKMIAYAKRHNKFVVLAGRRY